MANPNYTTRSMRRRRGTDMWEISFSHRDPFTGEQVRTYHTVEAKTQKQALRKRDALILDLERRGGALASGTTVREFMDRFLEYKEKSGTIEASTVRSYRTEARLISRYMGSEPLTAATFQTLKAMHAQSKLKMLEFGLAGNPFILGTQEPESRPYNPTQLGKDFAAFCKMNGFDCTFHDLRHTFATMMIGAGTDVRFF